MFGTLEDLRGYINLPADDSERESYINDIGDDDGLQVYDTVEEAMKSLQADEAVYEYRRRFEYVGSHQDRE